MTLLHQSNLQMSRVNEGRLKAPLHRHSKQGFPGLPLWRLIGGYLQQQAKPRNKLHVQRTHFPPTEPVVHPCSMRSTIGLIYDMLKFTTEWMIYNDVY